MGRHPALRTSPHVARTVLLWRVRRDDHEVRCEMEPVLSGTPGGCYLLLFIDNRLANCGFHASRQSLLDCALDLHRALRNIVWDEGAGLESEIGERTH